MTQGAAHFAEEQSIKNRSMRTSHIPAAYLQSPDLDQALSAPLSIKFKIINPLAQLSSSRLDLLITPRGPGIQKPMASISFEKSISIPVDHCSTLPHFIESRSCFIVIYCDFYIAPWPSKGEKVIKGKIKMHNSSYLHSKHENCRGSIRS